MRSSPLCHLITPLSPAKHTTSYEADLYAEPDKHDPDALDDRGSCVFACSLRVPLSLLFRAVPSSNSVVSLLPTLSFSAYAHASPCVYVPPCVSVSVVGFQHSSVSVFVFHCF